LAICYPKSTQFPVHEQGPLHHEKNSLFSFAHCKHVYAQELLLWAVKRGLHVLSDEIYANSKFGFVVALYAVLRLRLLTTSSFFHVATEETERHLDLTE
jgi:hypothetical protein